MNILVVGNGFTRLERPDEHYVNHHTANFLVALAEGGHTVTFAQPVLHLASQAGLNNARLSARHVRTLDLDKRSPASFLWALHATLIADFVYLFYPGRWPRLLGRIRRALGKPYGLYLRGERFGDGDSEVKLLKAATVICAEAGLELRALPHNPHVIAIAPMLDMTEQEATERDFRNVESRPLRVLFVGRLEDAKGIPELIEAARLLKARGLACAMRLVGGGPLYDGLAISLRQPGAPDIVLAGLVDSKDSLMEHYEWADVLVLPSHHEGFPRVIFEGMLKSCVIVTTMVGGIPALMKDGQNCLALPLRDEVAIANVLQRLPRDWALMQALAEAGRQTVFDVLRSRPSHIDSVRKVLDVRP